MNADAKILEVARSIRSDAWVDMAAGGAFSLGFADNREAASYNETARRAATALKAAGFRVTVRDGNEHWPLAIVKVHA